MRGCCRSDRPDGRRLVRIDGSHRPPAAGTYRCAACNAELFDSDTKYDSGTGWPSFTQPLSEDAVEHVKERSFLGGSQTEVRCRSCASHLGHVFADGPHPTGQRYCMNSVALTLETKPNSA